MRASVLILMSIALWFVAFEAAVAWPQYGDSLLMAAFIGNVALLMVAAQSQ